MLTHLMSIECCTVATILVSANVSWTERTMAFANPFSILLHTNRFGILKEGVSLEENFLSLLLIRRVSFLSILRNSDSVVGSTFLNGVTCHLSDLVRVFKFILKVAALNISYFELNELVMTYFLVVLPS